jgi:hypothetical protein
MKRDWWTENYQNALLILGILLAGLGIYELQDSFVIKSRLVELSGTIRSADTYTESNTDRKGHSSQKGELIFYLNGHNKKFYMAHNIGDEYFDKEYENIAIQLKRADNVSVWVRGRDIDEYQPKIFQITSGDEVILDYDNVRTEKSALTMFMLIFGFGSILLFLYLRFPQKWRKIMN